MKPDILWQVPLSSAGLGGVAATESVVIVSDRELDDTVDVWRCFNSDGTPKWSIRNPAPGNLDYGNSPRATPVIVDGLVYLAGAFGHLTCVTLSTGDVTWETNLRDEYEPPEPPKWGSCSTPLVLDGRVIVNPGAKDASLVALDAKTGRELWKCPGRPAGYGSLIAMKVGGKKQIIGHDDTSLGGWDPATGRRLWRMLPPRPGDFNVPTPIVVGEKLLICTENNGSRIYEFDDAGKLKPKPLATNNRLAPDTHTPVVTCGRVFGVWRRLFCLSLAKNLKELWTADDQAFTKYGTLVADDARVLFISLSGELILIDARAEDFNPIARMKVLEEESSLYSHPAFIGDRLYLRGAKSLYALRLPGK